MRKNVASQYVAFQAVSTSDGSPVTTGTPVCYYTLDGGTQGTCSSTAVHEGNGCWSLALTQAETNGNHAVYTFTLSGAVSQSVNVYPVAYDETATYLPANIIQVSGSATAADNAEIVYDTDFTTNYNATRNAWVTNAQDFVGTTASDPFSGQIVAASVTGAVGSVTGAVGSVTAGVTLAAGAVTDASLAGGLEQVFETDFATNYNTTRGAWATNVQDFVGTTGADPFGGYVVAASVTGAVGSVTAGVTLAAGAVTDASLAGNMEIVFETDFATNYNQTRHAWVTNAQDFVGTTAADPFGGYIVAASVTGAVGSVTGAVGSVTGAVGSVTAGVTLAAGAITNASLAGNMEIVFETDFATNYNQTRSAWVTNAQDFVGTTASDPFNGQVVAADVTAAVAVDDIQDGAIGAAAVADIFSTTTLAEAYSTDGSAATPAQLLYDTLQSLTEFAISGTTLTVKKRDGSTTAGTYTLDSSSAPTSRTRAS